MAGATKSLRPSRVFVGIAFERMTPENRSFFTFSSRQFFLYFEQFVVFVIQKHAHATTPRKDRFVLATALDREVSLLII